jgi:hypothetical protein
MNGIRGLALLGISIGFAAATGSAHAVDWPPVRAIKPIDRSSPQAVAAEFRRAFAAGNWRRGFRAITADSQETFIGALLQRAGSWKRKEGVEKNRLLEILEDYEISESKLGNSDRSSTAYRGEFKHVKDKSGLFGKLAEFLARDARRQRGVHTVDVQFEAERMKFSNFVVKGTKATAEMSIDGNQLYPKLQITRIDGRWYVDFAEMVRNPHAGEKIKYREINRPLNSGRAGPIKYHRMSDRDTVSERELKWSDVPLER